MPVAPVIRGPQGTGKGTLANELMGSYFGMGLHFVHCSNPDHVLGEKNGLLATAVFTSLDECFQRGDHKSKQVLKSLLTEQYATLRKLFCDAVNIRTFNHLIISSNEDFCVYQDHDDRRFAVMDVKDTYANVQTYWKKVMNFIHNGGREGFLYYLLYTMRKRVDEVTNSGRNPLTYIPTCMDEDRWETKILSMDPLHKWLYLDVLQQPNKDLLRYVGGRCPPKATTYGLVINKSSLYTAYSVGCPESKAKKFMDERTFLNSVLKYLSCGKHTDTKKKDKYILKDYTSYTEKGYLGVKGKSLDECCENMRRGFMRCCKLDYDNTENVTMVFGDVSQLEAGEEEEEEVAVLL